MTMKTMYGLPAALVTSFALICFAACGSKDDCKDCPEPEPCEVDAGTEEDAEPEPEPEVDPCELCDAGTEEDAEPEEPEPEPPPPPTAGIRCLHVLDGANEVIEGCAFDYEPDETQFRDIIARYGHDGTNLVCENGVLITEHTGYYTVPVRCINAGHYKLVGEISTRIVEGLGTPQATRISGSFCSKRLEYVMNARNNVINLMPDLGFSNDLSCETAITQEQAYDVSVHMTLDCTDIVDCEPEDASQYLEAQGVSGELSGEPLLPKHLSLQAYPGRIPAGEVRRITVLLRYTPTAPAGQDPEPEQEMEVVVIVRNTDTPSDQVADSTDTDGSAGAGGAG